MRSTVRARWDSKRRSLLRNKWKPRLRLIRARERAIGCISHYPWKTPFLGPRTCGRRVWQEWKSHGSAGMSADDGVTYNKSSCKRSAGLQSLVLTRGAAPRPWLRALSLSTLIRPWTCRYCGHIFRLSLHFCLPIASPFGMQTCYAECPSWNTWRSNLRVCRMDNLPQFLTEEEGGTG